MKKTFITTKKAAERSTKSTYRIGYDQENRISNASELSSINEK